MKIDEVVEIISVLHGMCHTILYDDHIMHGHLVPQNPTED
jgi:hypothetical protein